MSTTTRGATQRPARPEGVRFYGGPFSNFVGGPIVVRCGRYQQLLGPPSRAALPVIPAATVEHFFQAMKATNWRDMATVLFADGPVEAKARGNTITLRGDWEAVKYDVMLDGLRAKFTIPFFRHQLLCTTDQYIYEDSPTDAIWGLWNAEEQAWTGQNLLGKALMQVRDEIREEVLSDPA